MPEVPGLQKMLKVPILLALICLSLGGSYCTPIQDKAAKPTDAKPNVNNNAKDLMSDGEQEDMSSGDADKNTVDLTAIMNQCNDSFRIEMAYIDSLMESGSFPDETDRTPKCYVRCVLEHAGVASEEGTFDPARAAEVFAGERGGKTMNDIQELATPCADRKESCKCERSYKFMKCLMESEIKEYVSK